MENQELDTVVENTVVENTVVENTVAEDAVAEDAVAEDAVAEDNENAGINEPADILAEGRNPDFNPYGRVYENNLPNQYPATNLDGPAGLGGWLVLVAIGRILGPLMLLNAIYQVFSIYFKSDLLAQLSSPDNKLYSALWKPMIFFELIGNILLLGLSVLLIILFFQKKKQFPKAYIGMMLINVLIMLIDLILLYQIQRTLTVDLNITATSQLITAIITSAIWIPYMLISKRVKNTFTR
ncbi:hypothetical protein CLHUN_01070 [Ruminiclostridium hungatei]|uniref:DUF2569 domain-containing protein n=1 Tax=Ruminiclostridium hungatei TaxID=48256 RepID=A0A1V4SSL4_RUMHU|nr:DUF2569 domain-containing protein [Ruminiclostridium hungatei]OPX46291.1 hypothetical protein CLHUN_01070 [Ruminiclostridium hungatei]